jgi:hypothetical protein
MGFHEVLWNSMRFYDVLVNRSVPTEANRGLTSYTYKPAASSAASCCFLPAQADQATQAGFLLSLTWLVDYYETACLEGTIKLQAGQVKRLIWLACWKVWL